MIDQTTSLLKKKEEKRFIETAKASFIETVKKTGSLFWGNLFLASTAYALILNSSFKDLTDEVRGSALKMFMPFISSVLAAIALTSFEVLGRALFNFPKKNDHVNILFFGEHKKLYVQSLVILIHVILGIDIAIGFLGKDQAARQRNFFYCLTIAVGISVSTEFAEFVKAKWNNDFDSTGRLTARQAFLYVFLSHFFIANVLGSRQFIEAFPEIGNAIAKEALPILGSATPYVLPLIANTVFPLLMAFLETAIKSQLSSHQKERYVCTPFGVFSIPRALVTTGIFYALLCASSFAAVSSLTNIGNDSASTASQSISASLSTQSNSPEQLNIFLKMCVSLNDPMFLLIAQIVATFGVTVAMPAAKLTVEKAREALGLICEKLYQFYNRSRDETKSLLEQPNNPYNRPSSVATATENDDTVVMDKGLDTPPNSGTPRAVRKYYTSWRCPNPFAYFKGLKGSLKQQKPDENIVLDIA